MDNLLSDPNEPSARISITIRLGGRMDTRTADTLQESVLEALLPETRRVVADFSGVTACDDSVAAALVQVEAALIDESCFLEVVGARECQGGPVRGRAVRKRRLQRYSRGPDQDRSPLARC
jgi:hypothetical protein